MDLNNQVSVKIREEKQRFVSLRFGEQRSKWSQTSSILNCSLIFPHNLSWLSERYNYTLSSLALAQLFV